MLNNFVIGVVVVMALSIVWNLKKYRHAQFVQVIWMISAALLMLLIRYVRVSLQRYLNYTTVFLIERLSMILMLMVLVGLAWLVWRRYIRPTRRYFSVDTVMMGLLVVFAVRMLVLFFIDSTQRGLHYERPFYHVLMFYYSCLFIMLVVMTLCQRWMKKPKSAQTILVLGTELNDDGSVVGVLQKRLNTALQYDKQHNHLLTFLLSGGETGFGIREAEQMAQYLKKKGVQECRIVLEPLSQNTYENLVYSKVVIQQQRLATPIVTVTSDFHIMRSRLLANRLGFETQWLAAPVPMSIWLYAIFREYIALLLLTKEISYILIVMSTILAWVQYA